MHAERSAKKWGGESEDYIGIHRWFDATASHVTDNRHRMVLHNGFGIALAEQVFGPAITNSAGRRVFVRDIGQQHILEDLGCIPSLAECLKDLPLRPWMAGARRILSGGLSLPEETADGSGNCRLHDDATLPESSANNRPV